LSPYILPTGPPIRIETEFDIAQALSVRNAAHMAGEDEGIESEDKREGQPNDPQWNGVSDGAAEAVRNAGEACSFTPKQGKHRRGPFPALATGVSFGGDQQASSHG
jgi:hypothetical protein